MRRAPSIALLAGVLLLTWASPVTAAEGPLDRVAPGIDQAIVVTAKDWRTTVATLRAYERRDGRWVEVIGPTRAMLGAAGMIPAKRRLQGTGETPAGTFAIPSAFGRKADPGTALPYTRVDRDDTWPYWPKDPATYNLLQTAPIDTSRHGTYVEHLWDMGRQYDYVAVMDYNLPRGEITTGPDGVRRAKTPADTRKGGGIFLHVSKGEPTAGCIAVNERTMRRILRWLDPSANPVIITRVA